MTRDVNRLAVVASRAAGDQGRRAEWAVAPWEGRLVSAGRRSGAALSRDCHRTGLGALARAVTHVPRLVAELVWQIALSLSLARSRELMGPATLLWLLSEQGSSSLAVPPPQFFCDLNGQPLARERAVVAALPRHAAASRRVAAYGQNFDTLLSYQRAAVAAVSCQQQPMTTGSLVALRRFVDQVLNQPQSLPEARARQRRFLARTSPDHNLKLVETHGHDAKVVLYRYFDLARTVGRLLADPRYAERLFTVPRGRLGLSRRGPKKRRAWPRHVGLAVTGAAAAALYAAGLAHLVVSLTAGL